MVSSTTSRETPFVPGLLFLTVTFLMRLSSHSCSTSLAEPHPPSKVANSRLVLGVKSSSGFDSSPRPKPTVCGSGSGAAPPPPPLTCRTVFCDVRVDGGCWRTVDFPSSSSDEYGFSGAVLKDSVLESVAAFEGMRSLSTGRGLAGLWAGPGGVLSGVRFGVGGLCWLVGVAGLGAWTLSTLWAGLAT